MTGKFEAKLRRIGNSVGIIIPADVLEDKHLHFGDVVTVDIEPPDYTERNKRMRALAGKYAGSGPFVRDKEDRVF